MDSMIVKLFEIIDEHFCWSKILPALDSTLWSLESTEKIKILQTWLGLYDVMVQYLRMDWLID